MRLRRSSAPAMVVAIALGLPAGAQAAQIGVETILSASTQGQYLAYEAAAGERNRVVVTYSARADTVRVQDSAGLTVLDGCVLQSPTVAVCTTKENEFGDQWELGDGDDTLRLDGAPRGAFEGSTVLDGAGNDTVLGSSIDDTLFDGPGRDKLSGRGGDDTLYAGAGADVLSGGTGTDTVDYDPPLGTPRRGGVRADLDGKADDGSTGERDQIRTDVENLGGTPFSDTLTGNGRANEIVGAGGADRIFGMAGNDTIDALLGSAVVDPGAGADRVQGGRIVRARDGRRDTISSCGLAVADRRDAVSGCTRVARARS